MLHLRGLSVIRVFPAFFIFIVKFSMDLKALDKVRVSEAFLEKLLCKESSIERKSRHFSIDWQGHGEERNLLKYSTILRQ
jgi:hypothetical protein